MTSPMIGLLDDPSLFMAVSYHRMLNILAFESYDGGSHRQFRDSITKHSTHDWMWITRPPRAWKWRMAVSAQEMVDDAMQQGVEKPDGIFTTSLTDVAALRSALPCGWRDIPLVLYMHENQVAYPTSDQRDASFAFTNLQSVLTADRVLFNSNWNMESFICGISELLTHSPDTSMANIEERIQDRSTVAWVPVEPPPIDSRVLHNTGSPIRIVWPHRWEHDKGPEELLSIARQHTASLNLRWIILGESFREIPEALRTFETEFAEHIDHMGFVESKEEYWSWLHKADWVLSTATHEFFGIAVVEALLAGCLPWLPQRLSYIELLPEHCRGLSPMSPAENQGEIRLAAKNHLHPATTPIGVGKIDDLCATVFRPGVSSGVEIREKTDRSISREFNITQ